MTAMRKISTAALLEAVPGWMSWLVLALALALSGCMSEERLAGSSTEAGNAGGKLSLENGDPAAGVSVALVSRTFVPDTSGVAEGDRRGVYYRTRTDGAGRFLVEGIEPGTYRVMAVGAAGGALAESLVVSPGPDTSRVERILKPLGSLRGVAKLVGTDRPVTLWVRPVATLKSPRIADAQGAFRLDSLPEGQYELLPQCFACVPADSAYRVWVKAGLDTLMPDTLKLYPDYFLGFPAAGPLEILSSTLPVAIGGKPSRAEDDAVRPLAVRWSWNGRQVPGRDRISSGKVSETAMVLDSALLDGDREGVAAVELIFPDTTVTRKWQVRITPRPEPLPLAALEADNAVPIPGVGEPKRWRFHVSSVRGLSDADVAFWGLTAQGAGNAFPAAPGWVELAVSGVDSSTVIGRGPQPLTFLVLPDSVYGGRVFRARRDERLADFGNIRLLDRGRLGFADTVIPAMRPEGLLLDRPRGPGVAQRYRVDASGRVAEVLGSPFPAGSGSAAEAPLLFWRSGGKGFAWDKPLLGASASLAVTRQGLAFGPGPSAAGMQVPQAELAALDAMLGPLSGDPPARPDTAPAPGGPAEYLYYAGRGLLLPAGDSDSLLAAFHGWLRRNGLDVSERAFPLRDAEWRFAGFAIDPGYRSVGDTLVLVLAADGTGAEVRETFSPGSLSHLAGGGFEAAYRLVQVGDSLVAESRGAAAHSRLFGDIEGRRALFAVAGLPAITVAFEDGLPVPVSGGALVSGRLEGAVAALDRTMASPGLLLDNGGIDGGAMGAGFLYTRDGGVELAWLFGGRNKVVIGWIRQ